MVAWVAAALAQEQVTLRAAEMVVSVRVARHAKAGWAGARLRQREHTKSARLCAERRLRLLLASTARERRVL